MIKEFYDCIFPTTTETVCLNEFEFKISLAFVYKVGIYNSELHLFCKLNIFNLQNIIDTRADICSTV